MAKSFSNYFAFCLFKDMMNIFAKGLVVVLFLVFFAGCGVYSFSPGGKSSIKTIAVTQFENKTIEYGLSSRMTDLVIDAFISDGNLKIVSASEADATLIGIMTNYERKPYTFDESDVVSQYVVKIVFDITLQSKDEKELWRENFYNEGIYSADEQTEDDGQELAAEKLVIDIINKTTKSW
ncbi:MAG: hypothetical protein GY865_18800 [candidate division Zixibacteria bacterium]|nr:hypothetical protein [candidate division Zixibacteria bacterium]